MVYEKTRSGDPDYDDKQPPEFHAGGVVVSAGDGVVISPVNGPVDGNGAHVSLVTDEREQDNRPSPGNVAKAGSLVQQYDEEDTPAAAPEAEADSADLEQIRSSQASVQAANLANAGVTDEVGQADESRTRTADITAAKGEDASASTPVKKATTPAAKK